MSRRSTRARKAVNNKIYELWIPIIELTEARFRNNNFLETFTIREEQGIKRRCYFSTMEQFKIWISIRACPAA